MNEEIYALIQALNERISRLEGSAGVSTIHRKIEINAGSDTTATLEAVGNEPNINLELTPKGTGLVTVRKFDWRDSDGNRMGGFTDEVI